MALLMPEMQEKNFNIDKCKQHSGKKLFCCEHCNKEIIGNIKLQKDILTHSTEKPFICDVCGKDFDQKINLVMHMCVHNIKKPYQYEKSNTKVSDSGNLLENMLIPTNIELHDCLICEREFTDKNKFLRHKCNIKETFQYEYSNTKVTKGGNLLENMIPANSELHECLICEREFTDKSKFLRHKCNIKETFQYEKSKAKVTNGGHLLENMIIPANAELHECLICEREFTDKSKFLRHKCDIKESFPNENSKAHGTNSSNIFENMIPPDVELHECLTCEREFTDKSKFLRHKCNIKKPFQNEKSNIKVTKSSDLLGNMLIPTNIELHNCHYCKREFTDKSKFLRHMRTHTGERPFKCTVCPKEFSQSYTLVRHMRTHTGEKPFGCYVCGRRFNQSGALRQHVRIHTGEKPYQCSICDKKFTSNGNLVHHVRVHTKD